MAEQISGDDYARYTFSFDEDHWDSLHNSNWEKTVAQLNDIQDLLLEDDSPSSLAAYSGDNFHSRIRGLEEDISGFENRIQDVESNLPDKAEFSLVTSLIEQVVIGRAADTPSGASAIQLKTPSAAELRKDDTLYIFDLENESARAVTVSGRHSEDVTSIGITGNISEPVHKGDFVFLDVNDIRRSLNVDDLRNVVWGGHSPDSINRDHETRINELETGLDGVSSGVKAATSLAYETQKAIEDVETAFGAIKTTAEEAALEAKKVDIADAPILKLARGYNEEKTTSIKVIWLDRASTALQPGDILFIVTREGGSKSLVVGGDQNLPIETSTIPLNEAYVLDAKAGDASENAGMIYLASTSVAAKVSARTNGNIVMDGNVVKSHNWNGTIEKNESGLYQIGRNDAGEPVGMGTQGWALTESGDVAATNVFLSGRVRMNEGVVRGDVVIKTPVNSDTSKITNALGTYTIDKAGVSVLARGEGDLIRAGQAVSVVVPGGDSNHQLGQFYGKVESGYSEARLAANSFGSKPAYLTLDSSGNIRLMADGVDDGLKGDITVNTGPSGELRIKSNYIRPTLLPKVSATNYESYNAHGALIDWLYNNRKSDFEFDVTVDPGDDEETQEADRQAQKDTIASEVNGMLFSDVTNLPIEVRQFTMRGYSDAYAEPNGSITIDEVVQTANNTNEIGDVGKWTFKTSTTAEGGGGARIRGFNWKYLKHEDYNDIPGEIEDLEADAPTWRYSNVSQREKEFDPGSTYTVAVWMKVDFLGFDTQYYYRDTREIETTSPPDFYANGHINYNTSSDGSIPDPMKQEIVIDDFGASGGGGVPADGVGVNWEENPDPNVGWSEYAYQKTGYDTKQSRYIGQNDDPKTFGFFLEVEHELTETTYHKKEFVLEPVSPINDSVTAEVSRQDGEPNKFDVDVSSKNASGGGSAEIEGYKWFINGNQQHSQYSKDNKSDTFTVSSDADHTFKVVMKVSHDVGGNNYPSNLKNKSAYPKRSDLSFSITASIDSGALGAYGLGNGCYLDYMAPTDDLGPSMNPDSVGINWQKYGAPGPAKDLSYSTAYGNEYNNETWNWGKGNSNSMVAYLKVDYGDLTYYIYDDESMYIPSKPNPLIARDTRWTVVEKKQDSEGTKRIYGDQTKVSSFSASEGDRHDFAYSDNRINSPHDPDSGWAWDGSWTDGDLMVHIRVEYDDLGIYVYAVDGDKGSYTGSQFVKQK